MKEFWFLACIVHILKASILITTLIPENPAALSTFPKI